MSRIVELQVENIKRLRAVTIRPDGHMVVLGGENGEGKSSVLDSILWAVGGKDEIEEVPIRVGQESARIELKMDDMVIRRTFNASGRTVLVVEDLRGKKQPSPQAILDRLTSKVAFDPLLFMRMDRKPQAAALRAAVGLDFAKLDESRAALYESRTLANREMDTAKALAASLPLHADAPAAEQSASDVISEIEAAQAHNATVAEVARKARGLETNLADARKSQSDIETEIAELEAKLKAKRAARDAAEQKVAGLVTQVAEAQAAEGRSKVTATEPLKAKLDGIEASNRKVRDNAARVAADKAIVAKQAASDALTAQIDTIDAEKARQLAATPFPIPGLSFNDSGVTLDGLPFGQASTAAQLRVSVAIAAAMNPKLRVMIVRDGALLDFKSLALLGELAKQHDLQVWVERVGQDEACSVVIEDGAAVPPTEPL